MRTKILMAVILMGLSASLMAQPTEVVPKKQGATDQIQMTKEKRDAFQAMRSARLNQLKGQMNGQRGAAMGLNLTDDQKKFFKESLLALRKQIKPLKNELGEAEAHQKTLMEAEKTDLGAINKNIDKIAALKVEMAKVMVKSRLEMRAQLTEEQRLKFEMMKGKMKQGKGMKPGKGMRGMQQGRMMRGMHQGQGPQGMRPQGMGPGMM